MKKLSLILIMAIMISSLGIAQNTTGQHNENPPLLMQQYTAPLAPPQGSGRLAPQPEPAGVPGPPSPPAGPTGIPIVQTIPTQTLLNNLSLAVSTVEKLNNLHLLSPSKVWIMRAPAGEIAIKGGVVYQGVVVAVVHFNPIDGSILPLGINPHAYQSNVQIQSIKTNLASVIDNLQILPAAEFIEPEACWVFPVAMGNTIVANIKIYCDGIHVVQDYMANQEMTFYGQ